MEKLLFDSFRNDPRIAAAKSLIREALIDYQEQLSFQNQGSVISSRDYQKMIDDFSEKRGGSLWYPYIGSGMGKGALVELADGSVKFDFISGIGAHWGQIGRAHV